MGFWDWFFGKRFSNNQNNCQAEKNEISKQQETISRLASELEIVNNSLGKIQEEDNNLRQENHYLILDKDTLKTSKEELKKEIDSLNAEIEKIQENLNKAKKELLEKIPTYDTFAEITKENGKLLTKDLPNSYKVSLWWELEKALWIIFAKDSITPYKDVPSSEIVEAISKEFDGRDENHPKLEIPELSDSTYRITTMENIRKIFEVSYVGLIPYIAELHDCDDFAREFFIHLTKYTLNSGLSIWGESGWGYHAYNLVVCSDGIVEIEPQMVGREENVKDYFKILPELIGVSGGYWIPRRIRDI